MPFEHAIGNPGLPAGKWGMYDTTHSIEMGQLGEAHARCLMLYDM